MLQRGQRPLHAAGEGRKRAEALSEASSAGDQFRGGRVRLNEGAEQELFPATRGLYHPKTATADLMMMPPSGLRRI